MNSQVILDGLIMYLGLIVLLTFHEFGHAWMASKCGDNTAKAQGRRSLNPLVHIDPVGTVLIPLVMIMSPLVGQYLIGWAKPVPVNVGNLRNPRLDDIFVSMAGPWMNLLLAVALMGIAKLALVTGSHGLAMLCVKTAQLSLLLCFFNLIPIPPLDGSHVVRSLIGMSYETYWHFARFGFVAVLLMLWFFPVVLETVWTISEKLSVIIGGWFGMMIV